MSENVLIVDDSLTVRMDLVQAFESAGLRAIPCATIAEARSMLAAERIHMAVLDVHLPDGDGIELLKELRDSERTANAAVIMLSSEAEIKDRIRGIKTGADEYVGKPYDANHVVARARELLRTRRADSRDTTQTILLIDDSATFRDTVRAALEDAGYEVAEASSGEEGLRMAADLRPSLMVVDGVLPGIDGSTVIRRVRLDAALRRTPCLLLTGSEDIDAELRALDAGADAFVRKEEDVELILARLVAVLRRSSDPSAEETASLLAPKRVLVVDDSVTFLHEVADALRDEGYDVALARSGEEALDLLAVQSVDCILLDIMMPGIGGHETCRRIKAAPVVRDIPLIILTSLDTREAMLDGIGAGADDFIAKSGEFDILRARVRAQIRRKQFEDEHRRIREELLRKELEAAEARAARELAEARAVLVEELERKNRELEAFCYSVSHDLRAPLRGIDGFSQALLEDYNHTLDSKGQEYLHRVRAATQRMGELIDDLLSLSRIARAEMDMDKTDLSMVARSVMTDLSRREPERSVKVNVQPGLLAHADLRLVRIALENLLGNAWKFTSKKENAEITFGMENGGQEPRFFVRDNGAGFSMTYAEKLFQPFQRLHREVDFPGTGIGLATVQRVVERHGGRVWAEGEVGSGATFYFTLGKGTRKS